MSDARWARNEMGQIAEMLREIDICMFVTRSNGSVRGRPMSNNRNVEYDGDSWFFSFRDSPKVAEIEADSRVELAYIATERGTWISIEGETEIVEDADRKRELWNEDLAQWFRDGPDDDDLVLLKVSAGRIHALGQRRGIDPRPRWRGRADRRT